MSPIEPPYDVQLTVSEVAGKYCPMGRDLFLKRVQGVEVQTSPVVLHGAACHSAVAQLVEHAKRLIYVKQRAHLDSSAASLRDFRPDIDLPQDVAGSQRSVVWDRLQKMCDFEVPRLSPDPA